MRNFPLFIVFLMLLAVLGCRKGPQPLPEQQDTIGHIGSGDIIGFYLLNEGNMNFNKASLDFYDYETGVYRRNIYNQINPQITKGLGDEGNDIKIYGSKMYVVVNNSIKVEVHDAYSGKSLKEISITNCRYVAFHEGKAYVSAYLGVVGDPNAAAGSVFEIDTTSLSVGRNVTVGRQPEEIAIVGNKLYVANSGGYSPPNYERTISVVDLGTFTEIKRIDVAINLHHLKADQYGDLYVSSRGDFYSIPSNLFVIDTETDLVKKRFDIQVSNFCIDDDIAYVCAGEFSYDTGEWLVSYRTLDVKTETLSTSQFITDGTEKAIKMPFGIAVHPISKDILVTDAGDYVTPGVLYCFDKDGKKKWQVTTGDIPSGIAFLNKN